MTSSLSAGAPRWNQRRLAQRGPIVGLGAPSRLSDAFDVEPNLRYHDALVSSISAAWDSDLVPALARRLA
jgi:hypothetical protein